MPVRTKVPVGGKVKTRQTQRGLVSESDGENEIFAPPSLSDFFEVYGTPTAISGVRQLTEYTEEDGNVVAYSTFEAVDPAEQSAVDTWAADIDADDESTIRNKIKNNPNADTLPAFNRRKV
jgi:hypothetical protein